MVTYKELIEIDDPIVPPEDTLSNALYTNTKMEYALRGSKRLANEIEQVEQTSTTEVISQPNKEETDDLDIQKHTGSRNTSQYQLLRVIVGAHEGWVRSLVVDPLSNKWFVSGSSDSTIKVWDLANSDCKAIITGHIMAVRCLEVSKRFPYLFSGSEDKEVKCFDLERTNSPLGCEIRNYHGHLGGVYAMSLHPELDILFTGGRDTVVRVWDIRSRAEIMTLTGHKGDITSIIANEMDPQIITSSTDGTIRLWDIRNQKTELTITQHSKSIRLMIQHPSESTFCSGDTLGNIKQWIFPQGDLLNEFKGDKGIINTMSINRTNNHLFTGYDNGNYEIYDYITGNLLETSKTIPSAGTSDSSIYCSKYDMLGLRLLTGESDHCIKIWGEA